MSLPQRLDTRTLLQNTAFTAIYSRLPFRPSAPQGLAFRLVSPEKSHLTFSEGVRSNGPQWTPADIDYPVVDDGDLGRDVWSLPKAAKSSPRLACVYCPRGLVANTRPTMRHQSCRQTVLYAGARYPRHSRGSYRKAVQYHVWVQPLFRQFATYLLNVIATLLEDTMFACALILERSW